MLKHKLSTKSQTQQPLSHPQCVWRAKTKTSAADAVYPLCYTGAAAVTVHFQLAAD